jgi:hypothetical protein
MIDIVEIRGWFAALGSLRQNWRLTLARGWKWLSAAVLMVPGALWRVALVFSREPAALVVAGLCVAVAYGAGDFSRKRADRVEISGLKSGLSAARETLATKRSEHAAETARQAVVIKDLEKRVAELSKPHPAPAAAVVAPIVPKVRAQRRPVETVSAPAKPSWSPF